MGRGPALALALAASWIAGPARGGPGQAPSATAPAAEVRAEADAVPIEATDRGALGAIARGLPKHGVVPPAVPARDAADAAWLQLGRALLDVFAPRSLKPRERDALLAQARPLAPFIRGLIPTHRRYRDLTKALAEAARGASQGQPLIHEPPYEVRVGKTAVEVAQLRDRLRYEGYGDPGVKGRLREYFDPRLKRALWRWQRDHGIPMTVVLDPFTRRHLNRPIGDRVGPLALALARWRQLDLREDAGRQVLVHLNTFHLTAEEDGVAAVTMPVVVGQAGDKNATPATSAPLFEVVTHPDWRVPRRIVEESLKPRVAGVVERLRDDGFSVRVDGGGRWWVRQPAGPDNPLGTLKFRLKGTRGVYLHDTTERKLFAQDDRARSHGCVRLGAPRELAGWLLADRVNPLAEALAAARTIAFELDPPVTVHLVYQTVSRAADGRVQRHPDIYALDAEALEGIDSAALIDALTSD